MNIEHNKTTHRYTMKIGEDTAFVNYQLRNDKMYLVHAQVPYSLRGEGHGKRLVEGCFELLTKEGHKAVAVCSYVRLIAMRSDKWRSIIEH